MGRKGALRDAGAYVKVFRSENYGNCVLLQVEDEWQAFTEFNPLLIGHESRDSAVGIATGYGLEGRSVRVRVPVRARFFSSYQFWGHPASYPMGTGSFFLWGKAVEGVKLTTSN
jgi:hypothetical protein